MMRLSRDNVESRFKCDGIFSVLYSMWTISRELRICVQKLKLENLQISAIRKNDKYQRRVSVWLCSGCDGWVWFRVNP